MRKIFGSAALALALTAAGCAVSQQQEVQMGQQEAAQVAQQLPIIDDPQLDGYINILGDSLAHLTSRSDLDWHFNIVNSSEVNAFALPGGFIYVNRGLIQTADKMDEVAGAMGHEIGHVVLRHSVKQMQQMQKANVGVALACILTSVCQSQAAQAAIQVGGTAVFAKFSREDEAQADEFAVPLVVKAGISPEGLVTLFQKLLQMEQSQPSAVEGWFATHPTEQSRIQDVQNLINKYPPAELASLTTDTQNFHIFQQRLESLPAPPPAATGQ